MFKLVNNPFKKEISEDKLEIKEGAAENRV